MVVHEDFSAFLASLGELQFFTAITQISHFTQMQHANIMSYF